MLSAKIVGNMMESKKPSRTTAQTDAVPVMKIATMAQTAAAVEKRPSSLEGAIRFMIAEPANRPIMKPNRCHFRVICRGLFRGARKRALREANHEASDSHLSAYVKKFSDDAANQMLVMPDALVGFGRGFRFCKRLSASLANFGQMCKIDQNCDKQKYSCDRQDTCR